MSEDDIRREAIHDQEAEGEATCSREVVESKHAAAVTDINPFGAGG